MGKQDHSIHTLIVDDEPLARSRIQQLLQPFEDIEVIGECSDGFEAVSRINREHPDLVFLDIQMPEKNGFEVLEELKKPLPYIIFVTAFDDFALKAFEFHALDYLLKPIDEDRFEESLKRVLGIIRKERGESVQEKLVDLLASWQEGNFEPASFRKKIPIKKSDRIFFIEDDEIIWVQASGKYVEVKTDKNTHKLRTLLSEFHEILDPDKFIRIHRSVVINIDHIEQINPWFRSEYQVEMSDQATFTTGRTYRKNLLILIET